jgi:hypothetical protein
MKKPPKHNHLIKTIRYCVEEGAYWDTRHAMTRQVERSIARLEILYVLKHGYHEPAKDRYDKTYKAWNYSMRGKTIDGEELRVIISFDTVGLLIITAITI